MAHGDAMVRSVAHCRSNIFLTGCAFARGYFDRRAYGQEVSVRILRRRPYGDEHDSSSLFGAFRYAAPYVIILLLLITRT